MQNDPKPEIPSTDPGDMLVEDFVNALARMDSALRTVDEALGKEHLLVKELVAAVAQIRHQEARILNMLEALSKVVADHDRTLRPQAPAAPKRSVN